MTLRDAITNAIKSHSSPTIGRGDIHGGQAGFIVYANELPFVVAEIEWAIGERAIKTPKPSKYAYRAAIKAVDDDNSPIGPIARALVAAYAIDVAPLIAERDALKEAVARYVERSNLGAAAAKHISDIAAERDRLAGEVERLTKERDDARAIVDGQAKDGEVCVVVSGLTGSGKSAIAGEIEIALRAIGVSVEWPGGKSEKNTTHADWQTALELYNPRVVIVERNIPREAK